MCRAEKRLSYPNGQPYELVRRMSETYSYRLTTALRPPRYATPIYRPNTLRCHSCTLRVLSLGTLCTPLDELHARFFQSYALTLDTADYIPKSYIDKVYKQLYKAQKAMYRKIGKTDKDYQKWFKERLPELIAERQQKLLQSEIHNKDGNADEQ